MKIGVLTGGGDVPGLNVAIKTVVREAAARAWQVVGFRKGWAGPLHVNPDDPASIAAWTLPLDPGAVRTIDRTGGTILHTSRTNPAKVKAKDVPDFLKPVYAADTNDVTPHVLNVLEKLQIDALIPIGGDDTLSYAARLHAEGAKVVAIPKTMDNDVFGTDFCIGFSTAVTRSVEAVTGIRTSAGSHERIAVIELFGRYSGETALMTGLLAAADRIVIPEAPADLDVLARLLADDRMRNPSRYAMLVVSEGATAAGGDMALSGEADAFGHQKLGGIGDRFGEAIKKRTGVDIVGQNLAYIMRSGPPDSLDRMVALAYGQMAVELLAEGRSGLMCALQDGRYAAVPADTSVKGKRRVDVDQLYDPAAYRPRVRGVSGKPMFLY